LTTALPSDAARPDDEAAALSLECLIANFVLSFFAQSNQRAFFESVTKDRQRIAGNRRREIELRSPFLPTATTVLGELRRQFHFGLRISSFSLSFEIRFSGRVIPRIGQPN
jgi:hypothetical protein